MIEITINNIDVTIYITKEDPEITVSAESAIDLLCYSDNFTLEFSELVLNRVPEPGGQYFEVFYYGDRIIVGQIIGVTENPQDTIELEFGTIDYLYAKGTFSTYRTEYEIVDMKKLRRSYDPAHTVDMWVPQSARYVTNKTDNIYGMLEDWRDAVKGENDLPHLIIDKKNEISGFGAYYTYYIEELKTQSELKKILRNTFTGERAKGRIKTYTGFFGEQSAIFDEEYAFNLQPNHKNIYFGQIKISYYKIGQIDYISIRGAIYPINEKTIDFDNPVTIDIKDSERLDRVQDDAIIVEFDTSGDEYPNPFNGYESEHNGVIYKFLREFNWSKTDGLRDRQKNIIEILEEELKHKYFSPGEIEDNNFTLKVLSMFNYNEIAFFTVKVSGEYIENGNRLIQMNLNADDIFHYYYKNAQGKELLSDLATVSDKIMIFRENKLIISDRDGAGHVEIDEKYIKADTSTEYIIVDREKVANIGSRGGASNGIVVLNGEEPFNVEEKTSVYYQFLQSGLKQTSHVEIPVWVLPTKKLIGKTLNDYGTILEVEYQPNMVNLRTEKRI